MHCDEFDRDLVVLRGIGSCEVGVTSSISRMLGVMILRKAAFTAWPVALLRSEEVGLSDCEVDSLKLDFVPGSCSAGVGSWL